MEGMLKKKVNFFPGWKDTMIPSQNGPGSKKGYSTLPRSTKTGASQSDTVQCHTQDPLFGQVLSVRKGYC